MTTPLLNALRAQGIALSPDQAIRVVALCAKLRGVEDTTAAEAIAASLATSEEDYQRVLAAVRVWQRSRPRSRARRIRFLALIPLILVAIWLLIPPKPVQAPDADADGYTAGTQDCNDQNPAIHPGAEELCDGQDNDCNGAIDERTTPAYQDEDGDGHGGALLAQLGCGEVAPSGSVPDGGDCDDDDPAIHPGAEEPSESAIDLNCDGLSGEPPIDPCAAVTPPPMIEPSSNIWWAGLGIFGLATLLLAASKRLAHRLTPAPSDLDALPGEALWTFNLPPFPPPLPQSALINARKAWSGALAEGRPELDVPGTVQEFSRHGGVPILRFQPRRVPRRLELWVLRSSRPDPWAHRVDALIEGLVALRLPLSVRYVDSDGWARGRALPSHPIAIPTEHPVLLVGAGPAPDGVVERALRRCPQAAWLNPMPDPARWEPTAPARWRPGLRPGREVYPAFPLSEAGLEGALLWLCGARPDPGCTRAAPRTLRERDRLRLVVLHGLLRVSGPIQTAAALARLFPDTPAELAQAAPAWLPDRATLAFSREYARSHGLLTQHGDPLVSGDPQINAAIEAIFLSARPTAGTAAYLRWEKDLALLRLATDRTDAPPLDALRAIARGPLGAELARDLAEGPGAPVRAKLGPEHADLFRAPGPVRLRRALRLASAALMLVGGGVSFVGWFTLLPEVPADEITPITLRYDGATEQGHRFLASWPDGVTPHLYRIEAGVLEGTSLLPVHLDDDGSFEVKNEPPGTCLMLEGVRARSPVVSIPGAQEPALVKLQADASDGLYEQAWLIPIGGSPRRGIVLNRGQTLRLPPGEYEVIHLHQATEAFKASVVNMPANTAQGEPELWQGLETIELKPREERTLVPTASDQPRWGPRAPMGASTVRAQLRWQGSLQPRVVLKATRDDGSEELCIAGVPCPLDLGTWTLSPESPEAFGGGCQAAGFFPIPGDPLPFVVEILCDASSGVDDVPAAPEAQNEAPFTLRLSVEFTAATIPPDEVEVRDMDGTRYPVHGGEVILPRAGEYDFSWHNPVLAWELGWTGIEPQAGDLYKINETNKISSDQGRLTLTPKPIFGALRIQGTIDGGAITFDMINSKESTFNNKSLMGTINDRESSMSLFWWVSTAGTLKLVPSNGISGPELNVEIVPGELKTVPWNLNYNDPWVAIPKVQIPFVAPAHGCNAEPPSEPWSLPWSTATNPRYQFYDVRTEVGKRPTCAPYGSLSPYEGKTIEDLSATLSAVWCTGLFSALNPSLDTIERPQGTAVMLSLKPDLINPTMTAEAICSASKRPDASGLPPEGGAE